MNSIMNIFKWDKPLCKQLSSGILSANKETRKQNEVKYLKNKIVTRKQISLQQINAKTEIYPIENNPTLKSMIDDLILKGWCDKPQKVSSFDLIPQAIYSMELEQIIEMMFHQAKMLAPCFDIPEVQVSLDKKSTNFSNAYRIEVVNDKVHLTVNPIFGYDKKLICAIMAHEVSRFILEKNEIENINNRMIDTAVFIFGFGEVFRIGIDIALSNFYYREGNRLGYFTASDYRVIHEYVLSLKKNLKKVRETSDAQLGDHDRMIKELISFYFGDSKRLESALQYAKRKNNYLTRGEAIEKIYEEQIEKRS